MIWPMAYQTFCSRHTMAPYMLCLCAETLAGLSLSPLSVSPVGLSVSSNLGLGLLAASWVQSKTTVPLEKTYQCYLSRHQVGVTEGSRRLQRFQVGVFAGTLALGVGLGVSFDNLAAKKAEHLANPSSPQVAPHTKATPKLTPPPLKAPAAA